MDEPERAVAPDAPLDRKLYVVGIGASSGGLRALKTLLSHVPPDAGIACVVVVHLSPEHESHLVSLLQPHTHMPVQQVTETVPVQPNRVYVIPPNANLDSIDTHLRLSALEDRRIERAPIDHFLRTLAATHDGTAIGVILTGAGSDGSLGLRQIKEHGGLTVVQDPEEAEFDSMPRNAIATGMVDVVAPLRDIPDSILRFCATEPRLPTPDADDGIGAADALALDRVLSELERRSKHELGVYTRATILRLIRHRMQLCHVETLEAYLEVVRGQPNEAQLLVEELLLSVTEFFREPEFYERLEQNVLRPLFVRKREPLDRLRAWSIGCSTGEEAYSLAMLAIEQKTAREQSVQLQVFATDMSDQMLMRAREGVYPSEVAASVSTARLERFFEQHAGHYQVRREVRDVVVFASHNLFRDPPYSHLDLIVCRNLLPDLQPEVRQGVLRLFHYALEPHGMLVVGTDEEIEEPELFVRQDGASIYRRKTGPRQPLQLPLAVRPFGSEPSDGPPPLHPMAASRQPPAIVHRQAMERYMPASVLVDAANKIVHYSTSAWMFLQIPGGELTHDVVRLVREPLRVHLENGLGLVRGRDLRSWTSEPVTVETEHGQRHLTLRIEAVVPLDVQELVLVIFDEFAVARPVKTPDWLPDGAAVSVVNRLGAGLQQANDRLRAIVDSDEEAAGAAGAAATNPPGNGELRAVLEELESSREELQAVNEELISLDRDNRQRIEELAQLSSDLHHLLQSTGIATLFLDAELRIVRFTPPIGDLFHIRYTDIGRLVSDLTHDLYYDRFVDDARRVLEDHSTVEQEVDSASGRSFLTRMLPYRTAGDRVDGVVITLVDITARRRAEIELRVADRRKDEFLAVLAHELRNPLAPLSSGVELLKVVGREADIVSKVTPVMARQVRQLVRMVDDLLEVSRISGGRLQLRRSPVLLRGIVRDAVASVRSQVERARQDLEVKVPDVPIVLDADAARLTQVLTNLLNNASKYTPDRGRLTLSAGVDGANAVVTVRDTGYGMPEDVASHVFEMFYRGADSRPRDSGLGIGLTIAKQLVEMHGGTLTVESAGRDLGSTFTMSIPLSSEAQLPASDEKTQNDELGGHRVLIVDDNVDAAEMLGMQVRTLGSNEVRTALSGEVALQTAPAFRPDIVLLDLGMPEMDGFEVARRIRQEPWGKDVMLVAVTGWGQEEHRQRTRDAGFDRHLTKPADPTDIESLLAHSSAPS